MLTKIIPACFTGVLKKVGFLDREKIATVDLVVTATDDGTPPLSSNITVHIVITDINDNAPIFEPHNTTYHVPENATIGDVVAAVIAFDNDIGYNSQISYSIISGGFGGFTINETTVSIFIIITPIY